MSKNKVCAVYGASDAKLGRSAFAITLRQQGIDRFSVTYDSQVSADLSYADAAAEFGSCIMHYESCRGVVDNRIKGEK